MTNSSLRALAALSALVLSSLFSVASAGAAVAIDANVVRNQGSAASSVTTPSFSTTAGNELLLAFVATDGVSSPNITVTGVTGGGLTWVLVKRTNVQLGTAEIWRAFAPNPLSGVTVRANLSQSVCSMLAVLSFTGVDTSGTNGSGAVGQTGTGSANPGAPTASLVTSRDASVVLGVGNDWDRPVSRTPGAGQAVVRQYLPPVGDTYWLQMQSSPIPLSGTSVTINDTAPTGDRYNLSIVEVLASTSGGSTFSISGSITNGGGSSVALSQNSATIATVTADSSGNYLFPSEPNGTYTVTPTKPGFTISPATQNVTVNGAPATVPPFTATAITWSLTGSIGPGTNGAGTTVTLSGAANKSTTADGSGNYTFSGLANGTYGVTPSKSGFTFNPTSQSATINNANATVPAFTATPAWTISGTITGDGGGATVTLSQNGSNIATTAANGSRSYTFSNILDGTYTGTPSKSGFTYTPASQNVTVSGANATVPAFAAVTWTLTGSIGPGTNGGGATVTLSGAASKSTTADGSGNYTFSGLGNGTYAVTPSKSGFTFNPTSQAATINNANATVPAFTATAVWTISGTVTGDGGGTTLTLSQNSSTVATTSANGSGSYTFSNVLDGSYTVTPAKSGFTYTPASQNVTVSGANATVPNFTAQSSGPPLLFPDLRDIIPTDRMSIVQTSNGKMFQYTHDTFNGGPGPLVIQPVFNAASGTYQGTQYIYSQNSSGTWTLRQQLPIAGAFIFDSDHGHFHFPFVTYGLYTVAANGGPGTPVAVSDKVSFCINDSFIYDPSLPNAGALGNLGSCNDPTSLRGLNIGAVDEYDQTDEGQSINISGVPDGTYWLRAVCDPENFLFDANKTNNETDVEIRITGTSIQVLQTVIPTLNAPPSITLTSPAGGSTVSGTVQLTASTSAPGGVQYLIDGQAIGGVVTGAPYTFSWDTTTLANGTHWLAAQTTDATGVTGTSPVVQVGVSNGTSSKPVVQLTSPATGSILSSTVTLYATVGGSLPISSVQFYVDLAPVGAPVTAPPYMISWDSTTVPDGQHTISASATDSGGNVGNSVPVTVNVDNSHPANLIGQEVVVSRDGAGSLTTPVFSTAAPSDLLVAFVAIDGPTSGGQTVTVTGAGLTWTLLERANTQLGTAEIWSARADGTLSSVTVTAQPGIGSSYHGSLTVIAFTNAAGTSVVGRAGAPNGAPDIYLPGVIAGDWVFAVGNDWDRAVARTPVSGQVLVHQNVDTQVGDTYWVQSLAAPATANALVDIHDTAPTSDQWNYAAVEIVATHH